MMTTRNFKNHLGLQLWSLNGVAKAGIGRALDQAQTFGFTEVETAGTGGLSDADFAAELRARGLTAVAAHVGYPLLTRDISAAVRHVQAVGARFAVCPVLPREQPFDAMRAQRAADEFNTWGAAFRAAGIRFGYHTHGFEFLPTADGGTSFDRLVQATDPALVGFEMDVFWVVHAGQDPVRLLEKYPDRWPLIHLKDMRCGATTGHSSGKADAVDKVPLGTGQIDWLAVLRASASVGVEHYIIEDESSDPLGGIPASLRYLHSLSL